VAPLAFAASLAHAQTSVNGASSTPLSTSTAGAVTITTNGSITLPSTSTAPIAAVTLDSSSTVSNSGTISSTGPTGTSTTNYVAGIATSVPNAGYTGEILNAGSITVAESDTSTDANADGVADTENKVLGAYASGSNRYGILVDGTGTFTGIPDATNNTANPTGETAIFSGGSITVVGENSAGIAVLTSVNGDMIVNGTISVTGGNLGTTDTSYGIITTGRINGAVSLGGTVSAAGGNAIGVAIENGANSVTLSGTITDSGYRNTTPRTSFAIGTIAIIEATPAEMMQSGPAFILAGNVTGGFDITAAVAATTTVTGVNEGTITAYGDAPALLVGNVSTATNIGPLSTTIDAGGHGLLVGGAVTGAGVYDNVNAVGMQIGGAYYVSQGSTTTIATTGPVNVSGGLNVTGTISASAYGNVLTAAGEPANSITYTPGSGYSLGPAQNGSATGLLIGAGATVPVIDVQSTATISATSLTNIPQTGNAPTVAAIEVNGTATGMVINNTGAIVAGIGATDILSNNVVVAQGGTAGTAYGIYDTGNSISAITVRSQRPTRPRTRPIP